MKTENEQSLEEFQDMRSKIRRRSIIQTALISITIICVSLGLSWWLVSPGSFMSYVWFLVLGIILFYVMGWLFNFLWDLFR